MPETLEDAVLARSPGSRRTRRPSRAPAPSLDAASCPTSLPGSWIAVARPRRAARRARGRGSSTRSGSSTVATTTSATSCCATPCTAASAGELRRLHARAGEFGADRGRDRDPCVGALRAGRDAPEAYRAALAGARGGGASPAARGVRALRRAVATSPTGCPGRARATLYEAYCEPPSPSTTSRSARRPCHERARAVPRGGTALGAARPRSPRRACPAGRSPLERARGAARRGRCRAGSLPGRAHRWCCPTARGAGVIELDAPRLDAGAVALARSPCPLGQIRRRPRMAITASTSSSRTADMTCSAGRVPGSARCSTSRAARATRSSRRTGVTAYRWLRCRGPGDGLPVEPVGLARASATRTRSSSRTAATSWPRRRRTSPWAEGAGTRRSARRDGAGGARQPARDARIALACSPSSRFGRGEVERARRCSRLAAISRPSGEVELLLPAIWGLAETALVDGRPGARARALRGGVRARPARPASGRCSCRSSSPACGPPCGSRPEGAERWLERITPLLAAGSATRRLSSTPMACSGPRARPSRLAPRWNPRLPAGMPRTDLGIAGAGLDLAAAIPGEPLSRRRPDPAQSLCGARRAPGSLRSAARVEELDRRGAAARRGRALVPALGAGVRGRAPVAPGLTNAEIAGELFALAEDGQRAHRAHPRQARGRPARRDRGVGGRDRFARPAG